MLLLNNNYFLRFVYGYVAYLVANDKIFRKSTDEKNYWINVQGNEFHFKSNDSLIRTRLYSVDLAEVQSDPENFDYSRVKKFTYATHHFAIGNETLDKIKRILDGDLEILGRLAPQFVKWFKKYNNDNSFQSTYFKYLGDEKNQSRIDFDNYHFFSFSNPKKFNDYFDCADVIYDKVKVETDWKGQDLSCSDRLRVLSLSKRNDNHALWGVYASQYKGICVELSLKDTVSAISRQGSTYDVVICGDVVYQKKQYQVLNAPKQILGLPTGRIIYLNSLIQSTFSKYSDWSFEEEFRVLLLLNKTDKKDFLQIEIPPLNVYEFVKSAQPSNTYQIVMERDLYPLKIKKKSNLFNKQVSQSNNSPNYNPFHLSKK